MSHRHYAKNIPQNLNAIKLLSVVFSEKCANLYFHTPDFLYDVRIVFRKGCRVSHKKYVLQCTVSERKI